LWSRRQSPAAKLPLGLALALAIAGSGAGIPIASAGISVKRAEHLPLDGHEDALTFRVRARGLVGTRAKLVRKRLAKEGHEGRDQAFTQGPLPGPSKLWASGNLLHGAG
jgi:hypothetical protein